MEATLKNVRAREYNFKKYRVPNEDNPRSESRVFMDFNETVIEHLENRRSRPYNQLRPVIAAVLREQGIRFEKLRYSRYAGCSMCPCSGGFIIVNGDIGKDYWVSVA